MIDSKFIKNLIFGKHFILAEFTKTSRPRIEKVILRPVEIKGKEMMQISYQDGIKDTTKNFFGRLAHQKVGEVLKMEFRNVSIETKEENITLEISDKGKIKMTKKRVESRELSRTHDKQKSHILNPNQRYDFLVETGVQNQDGTINAEHRKKFAQITEFLKIVDETIDKKSFPGQFTIYDFGSGNAYITFAIHYYFQEILGIKVKTVGVDEQKALVDRANERAKNLKWNMLSFVESDISSLRLTDQPDMVISLHACDTATDDALFQAIQNQAKYIFAVPCCHKYMQENLPRQKFPRPLHQVASHGILLQRTCDIVTDTFRAVILRIMGYKTDVFEFVDSTHSAKNIMIRGIKLPHGVDVKTYKREYEDLKNFWGVTPYLEKFVTI
jgi:hypothetical protein